MTTMPWPDPNAPRGDVDVFLRKHEDPAPYGLADLGEGATAPHEAPDMRSGPLMCKACGLVRVPFMRNFCKTCSTTGAGEL